MYINSELKCANAGVNQERDTMTFNKIDSNEKDEYCNDDDEDDNDFLAASKTLLNSCYT